MRSILRAFLVTLLIVQNVTPANAYPFYGWTLSASATDPLVNLSQPTTEVIPLYLWFWCSSLKDGISAARFTLDYSKSMTILDFEPGPGVVNSGTVDDLILALSGCPQGSFLVGRFLVQGDPDGQIAICIGPFGIPPDANVSYGCADPDQPFENATMGFLATDTSQKPCSYLPDFFQACDPMVSVGEFSWGRIKALYRIQ